jgi:hypothetical protein
MLVRRAAHGLEHEDLDAGSGSMWLSLMKPITRRPVSRSTSWLTSACITTAGGMVVDDAPTVRADRAVASRAQTWASHMARDTLSPRPCSDRLRGQATPTRPTGRFSHGAASSPQR